MTKAKTYIQVFPLTLPTVSLYCHCWTSFVSQRILVLYNLGKQFKNYLLTDPIFLNQKCSWKQILVFFCIFFLALQSHKACKGL